MLLVDQDINWHDGNVVELQLNGLADDRQKIRLAVDLQADGGGPASRTRYCCVGVDLKRVLISGDVGRLIRNRTSGNIDFMRMDFTGSTEILVVSLFGGTIEAEAAEFHLTEASK